MLKMDSKMPALTLSSELYQKLHTLAAKSGKSLEDCAEQAICEYLSGYEDFYHTDLECVSQTERSFFLSLDK